MDESSVRATDAQLLEAAAPDAIILAAGRGRRMGTDEPKVLCEVADRPMLAWVIDACRQGGVERCIIVVGHEGARVREMFEDADCRFVVQDQLLGTGHAAQQAEPLFDRQPRRDLFVLAGDGPLIQAATLHKLLLAHRRHESAATLATARLDDPSGYGRIVRDGDGQFETIVEQKDATADQLAINEVNPSYYCFASDLLFEALSCVRPHNEQKEYYLTDVPAILKSQGHVVHVVDAVPADDVLSINTPQQLEEVNGIMRQRLESQSAKIGDPR